MDNLPERNKPDLSSLRIDRSKKLDDRPRSRTWIYVVIVVILIAVGAGYLTLREQIAPTIQVKVATVSMISGSDAAASLVATGYVVAQRKAEVASKGTGRLKTLEFEEGDTVLAGQVIAVLDNEDIKAGVEMAKAAVKQAEIDTLNSGRAYRRAQGLLKSGGVTDVALEDAETAYKRSLAVLSGSIASLRNAEVSLENTIIRAPFSGTVLTKNAEVGEIVAPFASSASSKGSVVTLADMSSLEVEADVSESNINKVVIGRPVDIILDAYPTVRYPGVVKKIVPTADRSRATVLTKVGFTKIDSRVLPEMSARVNFYLDSSAVNSSARTLAVSRDAVTIQDGQKFVFRVDGDYVTAVRINAGRDLGKMVEVVDGLKDGERVVLSPPGKMTTGQKIDISL